MNFLQSLFNPQRSPSMPFNPAAAPVPDLGGNLQRMTEGAPDVSRAANIMQAIGQQPEVSPVQMPQQTAEPPRKRRSFLDTLGGISDVIARVGGAEALYQPTLDARADRERMLEVEEMQNRLREQQLQMGGQQIEAGQGELADAGRARLATALGAIATNPDAAALWPQIAAEAGIGEQQANAIGQIIQNNPDAAGVFARSLGWSPEPSRQGSQAKELQIYGLLAANDPVAAEAYLQSIANPDSMSEYQRAQLSIGLQRLGLEREKFEADVNAPGSPAADLTPGQKKLDQTFATVYNDYVARGGFADVQKGINQLREVRAQLEDGGVTGGITGYLPTPIRSVFNENSVSAQEAVEEVVQRNLRLILGAQFTREEGERLIERAYNPRLSEEENIRRLDRLIQQLETAAAETESASTYFEENGTLNGWRGNLPGTAPRPAAPARRPAPSRAPAAPARSAAPAPTVGANRQSIEAELRRRGIQVPR